MRPRSQRPSPLPSLLSGRHARLGSILGGAMAGLVDAAVNHEGPGDPRGLVGEKNVKTSLRLSFRATMILPSASTPWIWNTFFARSTPMVVILVMDGPL